MLTRPEVDEAEANSHEAEAKIALIVFGQILHFDPISQKNEIFSRFSTGLQKFRLKRALTWELY